MLYDPATLASRIQSPTQVRRRISPTKLSRSTKLHPLYVATHSKRTNPLCSMQKKPKTQNLAYTLLLEASRKIEERLRR